VLAGRLLGNGGVWFREAETESENVEPNRKASIGYLAYMVKKCLHPPLHRIFDAEQSGKL
jgi:hypothetical protein